MYDIKNILGKNLKKYRNDALLTQEQLAEQVEVKTQTIGLIETGKQFLTVETLEKICDILNVSPRMLFNNIEVNNTNKDYIISDLMNMIKELSSKDLKLLQKVINIYIEENQ